MSSGLSYVVVSCHSSLGACRLSPVVIVLPVSHCSWFLHVSSFFSYLFLLSFLCGCLAMYVRWFPLAGCRWSGCRGNRGSQGVGAASAVATGWLKISCLAGSWAARSAAAAVGINC